MPSVIGRPDTRENRSERPLTARRHPGLFATGRRGGFDPIEDRLRANVRVTIEAVFGLFQGAVGKDVVSRAWRKVKVDWGAWAARSLAEEDIVRLILDGTVIRTRLDRKATNIAGRWPPSACAAMARRSCSRSGTWAARARPRGAVRAAYAAASAATVHPNLDDLDARGLKRPEFVIVDGAPGLEAALTALWGEELPIQRCTVHKHRNLLAHAPKHLHDELTEDYRDMIYADTGAEIETRRKAFLRKWRLKCRAVADSLEEAGDRLFIFTRLDPSQWKSARTTNAIERLNEEFRRRIKTQTVLPCAETVPMLFWALLASGQIRMRKVDGWQTQSQPLEPMRLDLAA
jgi:putative transposase